MPGPRRAVIVADAPNPDLTPFAELIARADLVVAADGGARHLMTQGTLPHLAVGDFDSLEPDLLAQLESLGVTVERHPPQKNETDLELALMAAIERGATEIRVLAALGGRPDQHLANLQLLAHPALAEADVRLFQDRWEVFVIHRAAAIHGAKGDTVSLLPMTDEVRGIVTEGLCYPLRDESLRLGPARGVSNVIVDSPARVIVRSGLLLCMHEFGATD